MKKKLFALSGVFLIVLVITGLWATRADDIMGVINEEQEIASAATPLATEMTLQQMVTESDVIATGECVETGIVWIDRNLYTRVRISVTEVVKGGSYEELVVMLPGGIDANRKIPIAMKHAGAPQIAIGEKVFLFLVPEGANSFAVTGFSAGKYSIVDSEGEPVVTRVPIMKPIERNVGVMRGTPQGILLSEFKKRVEGYLK